MKLLATIFLILPLLSVWADARPSILFVNVDDWNDWNQVLKGHPQAITPNIQRLADRGLVFSKAICPSPMCFPSRSAIFSGVHPARSGNITNRNAINPWRSYVSEAVTLPKHLSAQGWKSIGIGKNFHGGDRAEFDEYLPRRKEPGKIPGSGINLNPSGHWGVAAVPVKEMPDYISVSRGIETIKGVTGPLFLSLGIYRPHVPWVVPKEYFDMYPLEDIQFPERRSDDLDDLPARFKLLAHNEAKFGKGYNQMLAAKGYDKQFVRAYLACLTFADEQLGRLLDAWEASPHAAGGYIVMWSDHGYMLGEKEGWSKMKPWFDSTRSNLIFAGPGIPKGRVCHKAVSLQDLYPTLIDLLQLPSPAQTLDGRSLRSLLKTPDTEWNKPVVASSEVDGIRYDSVLDNHYRMTRLITGETELYKLGKDPHEFNNIAGNPEYAPVITRLSTVLTFSHPEIPENGWLEAESLPAQTSSDFKMRGNCHYPQVQNHASGGRVLVADLYAGKGSYLDVVVHVTTAGAYRIGATLQAGGPCTVAIGDVVEDVAQADAGYPMKTLALIPNKTAELTTQSFGTVSFEKAGLKLIRFSAKGRKQQLRIDKIQFSQQ